jgi:hypothetical protein
MNLIDRQGNVHSDPLHVRPSAPADIVPVVECAQDRDPEHDIPRRIAGRDLAYASIARRVLDSHAIQPHFRRDGEQIAALLAEAARLGYEMGYGAR